MRDALEKIVSLVHGDGGSVSYTLPEYIGQPIHFRIHGIGRVSSLFLYNDGKVVLYKNPPWWSLSGTSTEIHMGPWWTIRYGDLKSCR